MPEEDLDKVIFSENWDATTRMHREMEGVTNQLKTLRDMVQMQAITFEGILYYLISAWDFDDYLAEHPDV